MKKILFATLLFTSIAQYANAQEYCSNFKVVSIFDMPPTPQTPGGNYFLLLLTIEEDNPDNLDIYANLFFIDDQNDTISIPTGPSSTLPLYASDTIPYILKLNSIVSNQDFPENFTGDLVIIHSSQPVCEVPFTNIPTNTNDFTQKNSIKFYPNPFVNRLQITSEELIDKIQIIDNNGRLINQYQPLSKSFDMNIAQLVSGEYYIITYFQNGKIDVSKVLKM